MSNNLKILIVDDNEEFCENIKDILELKGYEVDMANSGFEALETIEKNNYNIVLLDIKMPIMNGFETFKKIKRINPNIIVIMLTAYAVEELIRDSLREGAFGVLRKPIDFEKLFELIEKSIKKDTLIFIVDDDQRLCGNLEEILTAKNYTVSVAHNGKEALEKAKEENFKIIILDMKIPMLNGYETFCAIRDLRPDVVVIIITGYIDEFGNLVERAIEKNAYTCLEKPFNTEKLINLIEEIKGKGFKK